MGYNFRIMKKYLMLFCLCFMLSLVVNVHQEIYPDDSTTDSGQQSLPISPNQAPHSEHYSGKSYRDPESWWRLAYMYLGWPAGTTIWALVITFAVISEQTMETRKAAVAGERSAKIQIAAERAWVVIHSAMKGYTPQLNDRLQYWWEIRNTGNTPAQIIQTQCKYELVAAENMLALSDVPVYPKPIECGGHLLAPNDTWDFMTFCTDHLGKMILRLQPQGEVQAIEEGLTVLRVYGYVKYLDAFGEERESRFAEYFAWPQKGQPRIDGFRKLIGAPSEYIKCT
jgi:hypothetical protein